MQVEPRWIAPCAFLLGLVAFVSACASQPQGTGVRAVLPDAQVAELGAAAFADIARRTSPSREQHALEFVSCVAERLERVLENGSGEGRRLEPVVFASPRAGAFALPGGGIAVDRGLLSLVRNQHQLAALLAHELAHIAARHPQRRLAEALGSKLGAVQTGASNGGPLAEDSPDRALALAALGYGPGLDELLPYSFDQESEADAGGLELMARAGFNPRESVEIWKILRRAPGARRPQYFRSHTHNERRIHRLYDAMGRSLAIFETSREAGLRPSCE